MAYATVTDYTTYAGAAPSVDITVLLERASELIDYITLNKASFLLETDPKYQNLVKAVCSQVEFWLNSDEDREFNESVKSFEAASNRVEYVNGSGYLAPRAKRLLFLAGLLNRGIYTNTTYNKSDYLF